MEGRVSLTQSPLKRKPVLVPAEKVEDEKMLKQQKPDAPLEELGDAGQDDKKGKSILSAADKGKGKMMVEKEKNSDDEVGRESGDSSVEEDGGSEVEYEETDLSDDPLAEINVDNILQERTRTGGVLVPGTYRMEGDDGDDDDDDDGDEAVEKDEEYKEGEEEEEEEKEEEKEEKKEEETK